MNDPFQLYLDLLAARAPLSRIPSDLRRLAAELPPSTRPWARFSEN